MTNRGTLMLLFLLMLSLVGAASADDDVKVVARWKHIDGVITLYSNGKINDPAGSHTWTQNNRTLILKWKDAKAPGGFWVDTCAISPDGQTYKGTNQLNRPISGTLVKDAPAAKGGDKPPVGPPVPAPAGAASADVWKVLQLVSLDYDLNYKKVPRDHSLPPYVPLMTSKSAGVGEVAALSAKWEIDIWEMQKAFKDRVGSVENFLGVATPRPPGAKPDAVQPKTPAEVELALAKAKLDGLLWRFTKIELTVPETKNEGKGDIGKMSQASAEFYRTQLLLAHKQAVLWSRAEALAKVAANGDNTRGNDIEVKGVFDKGKTWGTVTVKNKSKTDLEHVTITLLAPKKALPPGTPKLDFYLGYAIGQTNDEKPDPKDPFKLNPGTNLKNAADQDRAFREMPVQVFVHVPKLAPGMECEIRLFRSSAEFAQTVSAMYSVFAPGVAIEGKPLPGYEAEKNNKTAVAVDPNDPLPKGSVWRGPVKWTQAGTPDITRTAEITITARNDDKFKGVLKYFGNGANGNASDIVGTVADGTFKFELVSSAGKAGLLHTGTIKGNKIEFTYEEGGDKPRKSVTNLDRVPPNKK